MILGQSEEPPNGQQKNLVKFNVDSNGGPIEVKLGDVNRLFFDLRRYNDQFSLGAMLSRIIISRIEPEEGQTGQPLAELADEEGNQQANAFFLGAIHKSLLENIGLAVEPISGGATIMAQTESASQGQMRINVRDQNRFTSFLTALEPEQTIETGLKDHLEKLSELLSQQISERYNLIAPETEALELFGGLEKIIAEYKRLGMGGQ